MAITVFGARGIGGITGAALARAGHDVVLADQAFDEFDPTTYRAAAGGDAGTIGRAMAAVTRHYRAHTKTKTGIRRDLACGARPRWRRTSAPPSSGPSGLASRCP